MSLVTLVVCLLISTQSHVTPATIQDLQQQVTAIYADVGVDVKWTHTPQPGAFLLNVLPVMPPILGCELGFGCAAIDRRNVHPFIGYIASDTILQYELRNRLLRGKML